MKRYLLIHYGEIGLKGSNKEYFVMKLQRRVKVKLEQKFKKNFLVKHTLGRLLIPLPAGFGTKNEEKYAEILNRIFGIKNFKFVYEGATELKKLGAQIWKNMPNFLEKPEGFRVKAKRSMVLPFKSVEAERDIGAILLENGIDMKVKMKGADFIVDIEFFNNHGYFSYKKYMGAGGLSPNSQSKLISLISSGIDSPVASYLMMRRGARIIFVHFHGFPYTPKDEMEQVKELVKILSEYQFDTKLYLIPFGQVQKAISMNLDIPGKIRTVLYRRLMVRIAERIAKKEKAMGLVTGDSFGQVASQTPENILVIHDASTIPVYQPLIGFDKEDTIKIAERIGTFGISKLTCRESCTMFMPKIPEIRANVYDTRRYEEKIDVEKWVEKVLKESEVMNFD